MAGTVEVERFLPIENAAFVKNLISVSACNSKLIGDYRVLLQ
jgi:hypothetical protein